MSHCCTMCIIVHSRSIPGRQDTFTDTFFQKFSLCTKNYYSCMCKNNRCEMRCFCFKVGKNWTVTFSSKKHLVCSNTMCEHLHCNCAAIILPWSRIKELGRLNSVLKRSVLLFNYTWAEVKKSAGTTSLKWIVIKFNTAE